MSFFTELLLRSLCQRAVSVVAKRAFDTAVIYLFGIVLYCGAYLGTLRPFDVGWGTQCKLLL